jgi:putative sterol carrier protein
MMYRFPSPQWIEQFKNEINASPDYRYSAANWEAGPICFVINADERVGLPEKHFLWLDLHRGECRQARLVTAEEAEKASFIISGDYDRWKELLTGGLDGVQALMMGKIKVRGDLTLLMRFTKAANDLIACAARVPTEFLDDVAR